MKTKGEYKKSRRRGVEGSRSEAGTMTITRRAKSLMGTAVFYLAVCAAVGGVGNAQQISVQVYSSAPITISAADMASLPHQEVTVDEHGKSVNFEGVPLRLVLEKAGVAFDNSMHNKRLARYLQVDAADGYRVVFALPELDPGFTDRVILLADRVDGHPLDNKEGPFRIVVPGEKRMARWVRQVTSLKVVLIQ